MSQATDLAASRPSRSAGASIAVVGVLSLLLVLPLVYLGQPWATSQARDVSLLMLSQTPWNSPTQPELDVKALLRNESEEPLENLQLRATLYDALPSRGAYQASLDADPDVGIRGGPFEEPLENLPAGESLEVRFRSKVGFLAEGAAEGRIYPLKLEVVSGTTVIAELRTPVIFLTAKPKVPIDLAWTFVLSHPVTSFPDGSQVGRSLERAIAPGGPLESRIRALAALASADQPEPVDVAIAPSLLVQLTAMSRGYTVHLASGTEEFIAKGQGGAADATMMLTMLAQLAAGSGTKVSAQPFASPHLPRLIESGLGADVPTQVELGRLRVAEALGDLEPRVLVPPGSAIDEKSLSRLAALGVEVVPLAASTIEQPPQPNGFAAPATATLPGGGGGGGGGQATLTAITPEPGTQALLERPEGRDDPRLAAQVVLADLAAIWLEQPDTPRGVALFFGEDPSTVTASLGTLTRTVGAAPWIHTTPDSALAKRSPADPDARTKIAFSRPNPFPTNYLAQLAANRSLVTSLRSALATPEETDLPKMLEEDLLMAESESLVETGLGIQWLSGVRDSVRGVFAGVSIDAEQIFTLTAREGQIPVRVRNDTGLRLRVFVGLGSTRLRTLGQNPRPMTLDEQPAPVVFDVQAQTTGRFPVQVLIRTPDGALMSTGTLVVRSTAYSRLALLVAGLIVALLLILWTRRIIATRAQRHHTEGAGETDA